MISLYIDSFSIYYLKTNYLRLVLLEDFVSLIFRSSSNIKYSVSTNTVSGLTLRVSAPDKLSKEKPSLLFKFWDQRSK